MSGFASRDRSSPVVYDDDDGCDPEDPSDEQPRLIRESHARSSSDTRLGIDEEADPAAVRERAMALEQIRVQT